MTPPQLARVWSARVFVGLTVTWLAMLVTVPFAMAHEIGGRPATVLSAGSYLAGGLICHQRPARSFRLWGVQMPVCARCAGLYGGAALGAVVAGAWASGRRRAGQIQRDSHRGPRGVERASTLRWVVVATAVPTGASVVMETLGIVEGSTVIRAVGAIPLGAAVTWVVSLVIRGELA